MGAVGYRKAFPGPDWDYDDPFEGDTETHGYIYGSGTEVDPHMPVTSDMPFDVYDDFSYSLLLVYNSNGVWEANQAHYMNSFYEMDYLPKYDVKPYNLAPGDTTNKITVNGIEVTVQIGDILDYSCADYDEGYIIYDNVSGLENFKTNIIHDGTDTYYNKTACYVSPGVWSTTSASGTHRWIIVNPEKDPDHYVNQLIPRVVLLPEGLKPGSNVSTGMKLNGRDYTPGRADYFEVDRNDLKAFNYNADSDWSNSGFMSFITPGVWVAAYPDADSLDNYVYEEPVKSHVQLKWTDPPDLTDWDPYPVTWEGTVVVKKEDSPPLHRWDGTKVVKSSTRDKYKTTPYKDEDVESGKTYYYAFMPYYTKWDDPDHPIRFYTFTKVIKVEIGDKSLSSTINSIDVDGTNATIHFTLSQPDGGSFTSIKMYGKIGKNPKCDNTDDVVLDINDGDTSVDATGLQAKSVYYFCLVTNDTNNKKLSSNVVSCTTGSSVIIYSGTNKMTVTMVNDKLQFTIFNGNTAIYTFTTPNGITLSDTDKIYVSFLIDTNHNLAKPSLIYDNGNSTYNYNIETPSESEQAAIYTWLDGNWG